MRHKMQPSQPKVTVIRCDERSARSCGCREIPISTFLVICREKRHWSKEINCWSPGKQAHTHTYAHKPASIHLHTCMVKHRDKNTNRCLHTWVSTSIQIHCSDHLSIRIDTMLGNKSTSNPHNQTHGRNNGPVSLHCEHAINVCSNGTIWGGKGVVAFN